METTQASLDHLTWENPTYGNQESSAYNGYFECACYHPLFCFNQYGDMERTVLRNGNVHSADDWQSVLEPVKKWSLRTLRARLIKIGAKVVRHSRYVVFQMAEVAVPRTLFREILGRIGQLRATPELARAG